MEFKILRLKLQLIYIPKNKRKDEIEMPVARAVHIALNLVIL
jgi:hypothetical protein